jgi:hypothetical protein
VTKHFLVINGSPAHQHKTKKEIMKKILVMAGAALWLTACNDTKTDGTVDTTTQTTTTSTNPDTTGYGDTTATTTTTSSSTAYTPAEGDVTYRENKVKVRRGDAWVDANDDVRLDNGVVVYRTGKVKKDDHEIVLKDGEVVNRTGNFFDKSGRAIENAWDATKEGVKDAGKAIKKTAKKVGEKAKDAVDDDDNKH